MNCWKCHESLGGGAARPGAAKGGTPVCASCGAIQPPRPDDDLFAVLGLPRRFHLDADDIKRAWRDRSRQVHPDRFAGRTAVERRMSLQWTASINGAWRVLRDPVTRARYLATGAAEPKEAGSGRLDPDFLEEVFELQLEARVDPDGVRTRATQMRDEVMAAIDAAFTAWEAGEGDLSQVEERLSRMKYIHNLLQV